MTFPSSIQLGVNVDHIATVRQQRRGRFPDPVYAALVAEQAGAEGITAHLREDRRHIQERDIGLLKDTLQTRLNLEMAATRQMVDIALRIQPAHCCLVPERREELTTEGGLEAAGQATTLRSVCNELTAAGIVVSLFIDPEPSQIDAAKTIGAPCIELHTGVYADSTDVAARRREHARLAHAAQYAHALGLQVNAGHGLTLDNVQPIARMPEIVELNIGYSIVARALFVGFSTAVAEMKQALVAARA